MKAWSNLEKLCARTIQLRLVEPSDADFIFKLRTKGTLGLHLSTGSTNTLDQLNWLNAYKQREMLGTEFYFIVERKDGTACGTIRLYNISDDSFTWGSWILDTNKTSSAAIESALLIYKLGFDILNLKICFFDVRSENLPVISFHKKMGAKEIRRDELNTYFEFDPTLFRANLVKFERLISQI